MTTEEPAAQPAGTLHRALRMRHLVTLSIGGTVGSGFFLGAGERSLPLALVS
jgi:amino acid permease